MHQNLWWAVGYSVNAFPLAAGVFYRFTLAPDVAARLMSDSSAVMAINALILKRTKLAGMAVPGLVAWLKKVFTVMSGFMAGAGVLTVFVATVAEQGREHQAEALAKAAMDIRRSRQAFCSGMEP